MRGAQLHTAATLQRIAESLHLACKPTESAAMQARSLQLVSEILGDSHEQSRAAIWRLAQLQRSDGDEAAARATLHRWQRAAEDAGESAAEAEPLLELLEAGTAAEQTGAATTPS